MMKTKISIRRIFKKNNNNGDQRIFSFGIFSSNTSEVSLDEYEAPSIYFVIK